MRSRRYRTRSQAPSVWMRLLPDADARTYEHGHAAGRVRSRIIGHSWVLRTRYAEFRGWGLTRAAVDEDMERAYLSAYPDLSGDD